MPKESVSVEINASCATVFNLIHDYDRRLDWDSMLSNACLLGGVTSAGMGVRSRCVGTWRSAYLALETEYFQFEPGRLAAIKLVNHPYLFDHFAATLRHESLGATRSRTSYIYSFRSRPRFLAPVMEPIMNWLFKLEIQQRLRALQTFLERNNGVSVSAN